MKISLLLLILILSSCNTNYKKRVLLSHYNQSIIDGKISDYKKPIITKDKKIFFYAKAEVSKEEVNKIFFDLFQFRNNYNEVGSIIISARTSEIIFFKEDVENVLNEIEANYAIVYKLYNVVSVTDYGHSIYLEKDYMNTYNANIYYMIFFFTEKENFQQIEQK